MQMPPKHARTTGPAQLPPDFYTLTEEIGSMKFSLTLLHKAEGLALLILSVYLFSLLDYAWWWYPLLFFVPDVSFIGYLGGKRVGETVYNIVHHQGLAVAAYVLGGLLGLPLLSLTGIILLGHSSLDRLLGYGLLDPDAPNRFRKEPVSAS